MMTSHQAQLMKLRELLLQAEHGGMSDELLTEVHDRAGKLFTPDVMRLVDVLVADAREWRKRVSESKNTGRIL